ncbi:MAG: NAD-dependent epimerase/dehydratase family protein [Streptococcus sp.]|nr:NAD-dependent epimerase/dehydratase family protein [Streptococcus sp.]
MNKFVKNDVNRLLNREVPLFTKFKNKSILITGATGLLGSQIVFTLLKANERFNLNISIIILIRSLEKAKGIFQENFDELNYILGDIRNPLIYDGEIDYVIHGASVTNSKTFVEEPVDTIETLVDGSRNLFEFLKYKDISSIVYLSSLEVYGSFSGRKNVTEKDFGYLDPAQVRSSYSEGKRLVETICSAYYNQYHLPIKIARLCQTFGSGVDYNDNRVFAQFARAVIEHKPIVLHTEGKTERNYCSIIDSISGILYLLLNGESGEPYNIANENTLISIVDMAEMVSKYDETGKCKVIFDIQDINKFGYNPEVKINLISDKLQQLGWKPYDDLNNIFENLIGSMRESSDTH